MKLLSNALVLTTLRKCFGPTVRLQHVVEHGVRGVRVLLMERGQTYVLATCFSGAPEDRARTAAVWAVQGAM